LGCVAIIQKLQTQPLAKGKSITPALTIHPDPRYTPPYDLTIPQGLPPPLPDCNSYFPPNLTAAKKFFFYFSASSDRQPSVGNVLLIVNLSYLPHTTASLPFLFSNIIFFAKSLSTL